MAEKSVVDLVEAWQTGFFILVGCLLAGVLTALALGELDVPYGVPVGFFGGAVAAFFLVSYAIYGR